MKPQPSSRHTHAASAEADACRMEHGISPEAFEKLRRSIERQGEEVK